MRFEDDAAASPPSDLPTTGPGARSRRRTARPWSSPAPAERTGTDRPLSDAEWQAPAVNPGRPPSTAPLGQRPPVGGDLASVAQQLSGLQAQLSALQTAVAKPPPAPDASLVTGSELAAAIDGLGTALGGGMANLLTEHRNLLARDVNTAADRILDEVGTRVRQAATQTIDGVEERIRHLVTRALGELTEQLDLRLDKLQADVTGLRAVLLEIPDQASVTERLDQLAESISASRGRDGGRVSPALAASIDRSVAGPMEQLEESVNSVAAAVRELFDERLPEDLVESISEAVASGSESSPVDAAAIAALASEMKLLRRRISVRYPSGDESAEAEVEAETAAPDADADAVVVEPVPITDAARPAKAAKVSGRRGRRTITD